MAKKHIWMPLAFFMAGLGFYIYNGMEWNTWATYLPNIIGYALILCALGWALYKKEQYKNKKQ